MSFEYTMEMLSKDKASHFFDSLKKSDLVSYKSDNVIKLSGKNKNKWGHDVQLFLENKYIIITIIEKNCKIYELLSDSLINEKYICVEEGDENATDIKKNHISLKRMFNIT